MSRTALFPWLVVLAAVAQAVMSPLLDDLGLGADMATRSAPVTTPATPATYAFAIWGLIFLWTLVYAVYQALPSQRTSGIVAETRGPAFAAFAFNALWTVWVQLNAIDWVSLGLIVAGLISNLVVMARLRRYRAPAFSRDGLLVKAPLGLLAGWVTVAAFANAAAVHMQYDLHPLGLDLATQAAALIGAASLLAAIVALKSRGAVFYAAAAAWGLAAVIVRNLEGGDMPTLAVAAAGIAAVALALWLGARRT